MIKIGIAGASGSGKTHLTAQLQTLLGQQFAASEILVVSEDDYYREQSHLSDAQRLATNYDHPDALEHELLIKQIQQLEKGQAVRLPQYDYASHNRLTATRLAEPPRVLIVEGILLFSHAPLAEQFDARIFVDTPLDICLVRRLKRDLVERGRSVESVLTQYEQMVRPMYKAFIEPSRERADLILPYSATGGNQTQLLTGLIAGLS